VVREAWSWQCVNKLCVRGDNPDNPDPSNSLEQCRLTCGDFGSLWPLPTGFVAISDKVRYFHPSDVSFNLSSVTDFQAYAVKHLFTRMTRKFQDDLQIMCEEGCEIPSPRAIVSIDVVTASGDLTQNWLTEEGYAIDIQTRGDQVKVVIQAETVYGARHGLETLTQLMTYIPANKQLVVVTTAKVSDKPSYPHRGLLLDSARHYLPLSTLERTIDAMAAVKLNVLHWHISDSQSFPLVLERVPQLSKYGAYSQKEVYTLTNVSDLIGYARARGVRILLELDMPAHAGNGWQWGEFHGLGALAVCVNRQPWRQYCLQPPCGQLNPANPALYDVLGDVFKDIIKYFSTDAIHMGGDEVYIPCWNQSTEVTNWMKSRGKGLSTADFLDVWGEFHNKVVQVWDQQMGNSKTPVVLWTSHLTDPDYIQQYLDRDRYVIEAWTDAIDPTVDRLLSLGYRMIVATRDTWYLDHGFWGQTAYHNWRRGYDNRLPNKQGLLGGEAAMWGELVDDSNIDSRIWPRAAAVAERLWTNPTSDSSAAEYRLVAARDRLVRLGVQAEAIMPQWCKQNQGSCAGSANNS
ncbi:chitooligosaccharidolytic beta-N-acetylglucosaminidase, partial [Macrosteles quadrilineatus]|uniref:chitooligosaccharidolytic beta-N-acetylglucosaminidase n=1 Tax=Macrosteles quadrilineatus TaxID=74068 RepID=UPI0023E277FA